MEPILVIDSINVKIYGKDNNVVDIEIDDGRLSISISLPLVRYEKRYFDTTGKKARAKDEKKIIFYEKIRHNMVDLFKVATSERMLGKYYLSKMIFIRKFV